MCFINSSLEIQSKKEYNTNMKVFIYYLSLLWFSFLFESITVEPNW